MNSCPKCGTRFGAGQHLCPHDGTVLVPDEPPETEHVGKVLDGKYRLDSFLSRGGMGAVYRGTHVMLDRPVAVKLISSDLVKSPDMVRRFQREARAVTHLNHPNIVQVYDLGQAEDGTLYIAMEFVDGESLNAVIQRTGALPSARITAILEQIVSALALAHSHSIVHRDLKPHNIMMRRAADGRDIATLLDFGIAKTFEIDANTKLTATGSTLGTPQYMSPEQASGTEVDGRSDIYSLGIILYEMLVGEVPFNGSSTPTVLIKHLTEMPIHPSHRRPELHISPALEKIALRCLEKDPSKRFQTADDLAAELRRMPPDVVDIGGPTRPLSPTVLERAHAAQRPTSARTTPGAIHGTAPPLPSAPTEPGTRPTAPAFVAPPPVTPAAPQRSVVLPAAAALIVLAAIGGGYWAMTRSDDSGATAKPLNEISADPAGPAPQTTPAMAPEVVKTAPPAEQVAAPSPPPAPVARPRATTLPPVSQAPAAPSGITETPLSRALLARVRSLAAERNIAAPSIAVALEMTTRPSGLGRGLTADYSATVRSSRGEKVFSGSHLGFAELPLRNEVIEKVADEIVRYLSN